MSRAFIAALGLVWLAACGAEGPPPASTTQFPAEPQLSVERGELRPPLGGMTTAAGYVTIRNNGGAEDRLLGATSPNAASVELHDHIDKDGMKKMVRVESIPIPANGVVTLEPGGLHLMLFEFQSADGTAPVTLTFEKSGPVEVVLSASQKQSDKAESGHAH